MAKFMLILHGTPGYLQSVSPEELPRIFEKYQSWIDGVRARDGLTSSAKLMDEGGKRLSLKQGKLSVFDGPYSEAKEVIGGYMIISAENYDEAIAIASNCPHLAFGSSTIEVRQVDPMGCGEG